MKFRAWWVVAVACPGAAFAQPYGSVSLGRASADFPIEAPFNGLVDDKGMTYGLHFGVGFGERWAAELGYNGYDNFDGHATPCAVGAACIPVVTEESVSQTVYEAALVRRFMIKNLRFYGKAGYYRANIDTNIPFDESDFTENGLVLGIGMNWAFAAPWNISIEATRFDDNVSRFTVGVGWGLSFGKKGQSGSADDGN